MVYLLYSRKLIKVQVDECCPLYGSLESQDEQRSVSSVAKIKI